MITSLNGFLEAYMNCEGVRKDEIFKLQYIKEVVWRAMEDGLSIMIGGDTNADIWEVDVCENAMVEG